MRTALALAALTLLTRLPWLSRVLYDFDSIGFAFGVEDFDVSRHQPHPPGYSFYIALGKLMQFVVPDANRALVWLSALAGSAAVALIYLLGRRLFDRTTALFAALLFLTSPLFWTFGAVCAPYVFGALFGLLVAFLTWSGREGRASRYTAAALVTGLGSGFRPEILIVMSPLWLFSMRRLPWRKTLAAVLACGFGFLVWFLPTVLLSGGWQPYLEAVRLQSAGIWDQGVLVNLGKIVAYSLWALGAGSLLLPFVFRRAGETRPPWGFFALWLLPYGLLTTLVAFGQPGMLLTALPPLVLLIARGFVASAVSVPLAPAAGRAPARRGGRGRLAVLLVLGGNVLLFACAPLLSARGFLDDRASFVDKVRTEFFLLSGAGIRFTDRAYGELFPRILRGFPAAETLVFTNFKGWPYARYYLRGYEVHNYFCFYGLLDGRSHYVPEGDFPIPPGVRNILLLNGDKHSIHFQDTLTPYNRSPELTRAVEGAGPLGLSALEVSGKKKVLFRPDGFRVE